MKTLTEVFSRIDLGNTYRIQRHATRIKNPTFSKRYKASIDSKYGKELVYKVIETRNYKTYEYQVQIILSSKTVEDTKETIYKLVELNG